MWGEEVGANGRGEVWGMSQRAAQGTPRGRVVVSVGGGGWSSIIGGIVGGGGGGSMSVVGRCGSVMFCIVRVEFAGRSEKDVWMCGTVMVCAGEDAHLSADCVVQ